MTDPHGPQPHDARAAERRRRNRPSRPALDYRIGTHASFLHEMRLRLARLGAGEDTDADGNVSSGAAGAGTSADPCDAADRRPGGRWTGALSENAASGNAAQDDPAVALLDAWAVIADVLTFYQERIANEGFLGTARERKSLVELARLVGYTPRPGLSAGVHLAFQVDESQLPQAVGSDRLAFTPNTQPPSVTVPKGTAAQTIPGPGEEPQIFETTEALTARREWNQIHPRQTLPQRIDPDNAQNLADLWLSGTSTGLKPGDLLLLRFPDDVQDNSVVRRIVGVEPDNEASRTRVSLRTDRIPVDELLSAIHSAQRDLNDFQLPESEPDALKCLREAVAAAITLHNLFGSGSPTNLADVPVLVLDTRLDHHLGQAARRLGIGLSHPLTESRPGCPCCEAPKETSGNPAANCPDKLKSFQSVIGDYEDVIQLLQSFEESASNPVTALVIKNQVAMIGKGYGEQQQIAGRVMIRLKQRYDEISIADGVAAQMKVIQDTRNDVSNWLDDLLPIPTSFGAMQEGLTSLQKGLDSIPAIAEPVEGDPLRDEFLRLIRQYNGVNGRTPGQWLSDYDRYVRRVSDVLQALADSLSADVDLELGDIVEALDATVKILAEIRKDVRGFKTLRLRLDELESQLKRELETARSPVIEAMERMIDALGKYLNGDETPAMLKAKAEVIFREARKLINSSDLRWGERAWATFKAVLNTGFAALRSVEQVQESPVGRFLTSVIQPGRAELSTMHGQWIVSRNRVRDRLDEVGDGLMQLRREFRRRVQSAAEPLKALPATSDVDGYQRLLDALIEKLDPGIPLIQLVAWTGEICGIDREEVEGAVEGLADLPDDCPSAFIPDAPKTPNAQNATGAPEAPVTPNLPAQLPSLPPRTEAERTLSSVRNRLRALVLGLVGERNRGNIVARLIAALRRSKDLPDERLDQAAALLRPGSDVFARMEQALTPVLQGRLYEAWRHVVAEESTAEVYAFRARTGVFGHNAPLLIPDPKEPQFVHDLAAAPEGDEKGNRMFLYLDRHVPEALPGTFVLLPHRDLLGAASGTFDQSTVFEVKAASIQSRTAYGVSGDTTRLVLNGEWRPQPAALPGLPAVPALAAPLMPQVPVVPMVPLAVLVPPDVAMQRNELSQFSRLLRGTTVYAASERLPLAEEPNLEAVAEPVIELDGLYGGLVAGRPLIISGERADVSVLDGAERNRGINGASTQRVGGVEAAELVEVALVVHHPQLPSTRPESGAPAGSGTAASDAAGADRPVGRATTTLFLRRPLRHSYRRETVRIFGNVVPATHGQTRRETLGNGDASESFQSFGLGQPRLTHLPAATPRGLEAQLSVRVDGVEWRRADDLRELAAGERGYVVTIDERERATVTFGDGRNGARLPTGVANVRAEYRAGLGAVGNVAARRIAQLLAPPFGVTGVTNPLPSSGGADRETLDDARRNAPTAVATFGRLISVGDYADFARAFAGIGKASARSLPVDGAEHVFVTVAGSDDVPIDRNGPLYQNLRAALRDFGDPRQPFRLEPRELSLLIVRAKVRLQTGYAWEQVGPRIREALLERFSFRQVDLGEDLFSSDALVTAQRVEGVDFIDLDAFDAIPEHTRGEDLSVLTGNPVVRTRIEVQPARTRAPVFRPVPKDPSVDLKKFAEHVNASMPPGGTHTAETIRAFNVKLLKYYEGGPLHEYLRPRGANRLIVGYAEPEAPRPAQICYLSRAIPETLILEPLP